MRAGPEPNPDRIENLTGRWPGRGENRRPASRSRTLLQRNRELLAAAIAGVELLTAQSGSPPPNR